MTAKRGWSATIVPLWCVTAALTVACTGTSGVEQTPAGSAGAPWYQSSGATLRTVFTDSALYSRFCEPPASGQPDYRKCLLKDQSRQRSTAGPPPLVQP